ncbi:hypothetical protein ACQR16_33525 [Bradyrhizobium oligotrophicum]|uniref:hypothetical protein n=1 Tax=Bradyrhizobium oligotrophicum TaxID=44255 RepID=UPI003EB923B8
MIDVDHLLTTQRRAPTRTAPPRVVHADRLPVTNARAGLRLPSSQQARSVVANDTLEALEGLNQTVAMSLTDLRGMSVSIAPQLQIPQMTPVVRDGID